ncbi:MAG: hypothetical protein FE78DRAFT_199048 [Acidomyces sp. 'richmondensis']|nr:MAG: hypothetical protein FE78DRAFT_199048 [Acidomyces sp. 'richmondensis']
MPRLLRSRWSSTALFFENMTAFSLFHRPSFAGKLQMIDDDATCAALLAAMFAFSSRFRPYVPGRFAPADFHRMADHWIEAAQQRISDTTPSLPLLQAMTLNTFMHLTRGAKGTAWRALGLLVRMAYEMELHLVDVSGMVIDDAWVENEERRRLWWAIWELDVFASTVRRLPNAIDWQLNRTLLPVDDDAWFARQPQVSCFLLPDPSDRWKALVSSGTSSAKAWFIVLNSIMRSIQLLVCPSTSNVLEMPALPRQRAASDSVSPIIDSAASRDVQSHLVILGNCLYCTELHIPSCWAYDGRRLDFRRKTTVDSPDRIESQIYSIYIMIQLSKLMLHYRDVFNVSLPDPLESSGSADVQIPSSGLSWERFADRPSWQAYLEAAENILQIVTNSSPNHIMYVNPFLTTTIWFATAVFLVHRHLGTSEGSLERQVVQSKYDLLRSIVSKSMEFWNISPILATKFKILETELDRLENSKNQSERTSINGQAFDRFSKRRRSHKTQHRSTGIEPTRAQNSLEHMASTASSNLPFQCSNVSNPSNVPVGQQILGGGLQAEMDSTLGVPSEGTDVDMSGFNEAWLNLNDFEQPHLQSFLTGILAWE